VTDDWCSTLMKLNPRKPLRALLIEDCEADAELLLHELRDGGYEVAALRVDTAAGTRAALQAQTWDVVLSDYSMPAFSGPAALAIVREMGLDLPFMIVSGTIGEETAVSALKAGACDFLVKGRLARLLPALDRELRDVELRRERIRAQTALEEQLRQSQKMEAIGQLAGGIAHDFNNLLTSILGYASLITEQIGSEKTIGQDLREIVLAAERAAALTRQLLAFGRKQEMRAVSVSLNAIVQGVEPMLRRLIPANIKIRTVFDSAIHAVLADPIQLEQVILNLVVNARDAMRSEGGVVTIATENTDLDQEYVSARPDATIGDYATLTVTDTGTGMPPEVQARIFEPFYTTKELGRGTGLGLAVVHGIVKQLGGNIWVYSEPGHGTVFKIYLPKTEARVTTTVDRPAAPTVDGHETILLVEDEASVRSLARRILERHGYRVCEADSGEAALAALANGIDPPDLLMTDLNLPGINGAQLAHEVCRQHGTRVLFVSGYAEPTGLTMPANFELLEKPFTAQALLSRVRAVLSQDHVMS
jgi:signal transduction histidine kinase